MTLGLGLGLGFVVSEEDEEEAGEIEQCDTTSRIFVCSGRVVGMRVYVIVTLWDFFHMGRVLWVTFQVPANQSRSGGIKVGGDWFVVVLALDLVGGRRLIVKEGVVMVDVGRWVGRSRRYVEGR